MKSSKVFAVAVALSISAVDASAGRIDMSDPRRAVGRENDIRVDAQITQDTVSPGGAINVTYQVQNLTTRPVAVAPRLTDLSYDSDTGTITLSFGAEVPRDGALPELTLVGPGEKKTFTGGATFNVPVPKMRAGFSNEPRQVQLKVNVLTDVEPFRSAMAIVPVSRKGPMLSDEQFDAWLESNTTIFLNTVPVRWSPVKKSGVPSAADENSGQRGTW